MTDSDPLTDPPADPSADPPADPATLDGRRGSTAFDIADDGSTYTCVRVFGATPDRVFRAFTDPVDLRVWFPSGAPEGSKLTRCESDAVEGGRYHYEMFVPGHGEMAWHGEYTGVDRPDSLAANEWFVMGTAEPTGDPAVQTLTFETAGDGLTRMTMTVNLAEPEDPETFRTQSAVGLSASLNTMDELVSK